MPTLPTSDHAITSAPSSSPVDVAVILIGINARDFVRGCVDSLQKATWRDVTWEVIYADNGSTDDTVAVLKRDFPWVRIQENGKNIGFCPAANKAAAASSARYFYFINDDTLVLDDAIAMLVEYLDAHPDVASVGSRLLYPDMSEQWSGRAFPTLLSSIMGRRSPLTKLFPNAPWVRRYLCKDGIEKGEPFAVDWVSAAGQIVRPSDFKAVGGFAEDYYYWHEAIICGRLWKKNRKVMLHPQSRVIHYEGQGSGSRRPYRVRKWHITDFHRGAWRCYCEHHALGMAHPARWLIGLMLFSRYAMMLVVARLSTLGEKPAAPKSH